MKKIIMKKVMNYISRKCNYTEEQLIEIEYGLTGIYLTFSKIIIISIIACLLGIFKEMLIFMLLFNIIRTTAFGLHATKSWICLISSIIIFIIIPLICIYINLNIYIKGLLCIISTMLIYKNAPADTKKRPIVNKRRRKVLKLLSTLIAIVFIIISLLINNNFISNCLLFAIILEDFLISPLVYRIFNLPYNNYIDFLKSHPNFNS